MFDDSDSDSNYLSRFAYLKNTSELCFAPYISSLDFYPPLSCSTLAVLKVVSY